MSQNYRSKTPETSPVLQKRTVDHIEASLVHLRELLVRQFLFQTGGRLTEAAIRYVINEALALAAQVHLPHLVLPELASEKVRALEAWNNRQQDIWNRSVVVVTA